MAAFEIGSAITAIKAIKDLGKLAVDSKVDQQVQAKLMDAMSKIGDVQDALYELRDKLIDKQGEVEELRSKLVEAESWQRRFDQYELVRRDGGALVYRFKGEPAHYACPTCMEQKRVSLLQPPLNSTSGAQPCLVCKAFYQIDQNKPRKPLRSSKSNWVREW